MLVSFLLDSPQLWKPLDLGIFKANTDSFFGDKIGIGLIIRNHLRIPLLAKCIPRLGSFFVDYGKLGIIEGHIVSSIFTRRIDIESDSLLAIRSLF